MSCSASNSPIDISLNKVVGKCDLKCEYNFKYYESNCVATNRGDYISINYDSSSSPPVKYNNIDYEVKEIRVYSPSLHSFNGSKVDAEVIIVHVSSRGTKPLLVCLPCLKNDSNSQASRILTSIIENMSRSAPSDGESTTISVSDFNLNYFVPKKPFFSYTANIPYQPCVGNVDFIVFPVMESPVNITNASYKILTKFITQNTYGVKSGSQLFYNPKGPGASGVNDEIYIDCKPTNTSEDTTTIITQTAPPTYDLDYLKNSQFVQLVIGILLFIFIIYLFTFILRSFGKEDISSITNKIVGNST